VGCAGECEVGELFIIKLCVCMFVCFFFFVIVMCDVCMCDIQIQYI